MSVQITIRHVPEQVRQELAVRAASKGQSMQEYLRLELERLARRPTMERWLERVREDKKALPTNASTVDILDAIEADRR